MCIRDSTIIVEINQGDTLNISWQNLCKSTHCLGRVPQETSDGCMSYRSSTCPTPPISLGICRHKGSQASGMVHVETLDGDCVSIAIRRLHLVQVKTGREEQHRFTACRNQCLVN